MPHNCHQNYTQHKYTRLSKRTDGDNISPLKERLSLNYIKMWFTTTKYGKCCMFTNNDMFENVFSKAVNKEILFFLP